MFFSLRVIDWLGGQTALSVKACNDIVHVACFSRIENPGCLLLP